MAEIEANPYETRSDSFYFVDGELIMHHRADYSYKKSWLLVKFKILNKICNFFVIKIIWRK